MKNKYVQYGCGFSSPETWTNFDSSSTLYFEKIPLIGNLYTKNSSRYPKNVEYGNIIKGLPISFDSCQGVYCSHVIEHLSLEDMRLALSNTFKILKSGGYFRCVLPDLEYAINQYNQDSSPDAAISFLRQIEMGKENRPKKLMSIILDSLSSHEHLWMWDHKSIARELEKVGFINIRRAEFGDAADPVFNDVEDKTRWLNCLGIECYKP
jgi:ubiquinone/menaquinone biosynthesis C-methylase UbiE